MERTSGGVYNRRSKVLARLENQLETKLKRQRVPTKGGYMTLKETEALQDSDIKRIEKEISTLKKKITNG